MSNSFSISTRKCSSNKSRWWFQPNWKKQYQTNWIISPSRRSPRFPRFFWPDAASRWSRLGQSQQPWCGNYFNLPVSCQDASLAARNQSMTFFSCINHGKSRLDVVLEVSPRIYVEYQHVDAYGHSSGPFSGKAHNTNATSKHLTRVEPSHLLNGGTQVLSGIRTQLAQNLCGDLLRSKLLAHHRAVDLHFLALEVNLVGHLFQLFLHFVGLATNKALHWVEGVLRIHHTLSKAKRPLKQTLWKELTSTSLYPQHQTTMNAPLSWRLAIWPTKSSPLLEYATTLGVVRAPSAFGITVGEPASQSGKCWIAKHHFTISTYIPRHQRLMLHSISLLCAQHLQWSDLQIITKLQNLHSSHSGIRGAKVDANNLLTRGHFCAGSNLNRLICNDLQLPHAAMKCWQCQIKQ